MSGVSKAISDELFLQAQAALKKMGKTAKVSRKLQAIIAAKKFGISLAAQVFETSRQSLMTWIKNFEKDASDGFKIKAGRGRKAVATSGIRDFAANLLQKNPNIGNEELRQIIKEKHYVCMSLSSVNRLMSQLGLSYITPRPIHHKADISAQNDFKKTPRNHRKIATKKALFL